MRLPFVGFLGILSGLLAGLSSAFATQLPTAPSSEMREVFIQASREFEVPEALLEAIGFVESRWVQRLPADFNQTEASDRPLAYGVMGLRSDEWFGNSLDLAAQLIGESPDTLKLDAQSNIRGAAAYLHKLAQDNSVGGPLLVGWADAIALYSGIPGAPDSEEAQLFVREVLQAAGDLSYLFFSDVMPQAGGTDYPGAVLDPSPNFYSSADEAKYIVIHATEGDFAGALSWLKNPAAQVSAHYLIRSSDGLIVQLVPEAKTAWHALCWNPLSIGVEHEGFSATGEDLTPTLYQSSAKLVANIAFRHHIPLDAEHIIGHDYWQTASFKKQKVLANCNDHIDPGQYWDWTSYFDLLARQKD